MFIGYCTLNRRISAYLLTLKAMKALIVACLLMYVDVIRRLRTKVWWRWRESNPRPKDFSEQRLRVYPIR